ncbi:hypothetical protein [Ruminiclostridium papyrosolvens]|uniref:Uncharacterized protein n=1 Tax=Ruminiclostridium papyrosolvens C7 TaxID=1330534 RepID=U4QWY8_9FIRM|nr:hypothetical protein [Ruminiclostridium papyrosolvens]EPR08061.1 hypothetical protein L323_19080 [Ruminiclostridium papyrosolvens C7]
MEQLTNTSVIFKTANGLTRWFKASVLYKVMCVLLEWCRNSQINRFILGYLGRDSSLKYSSTYKVFSQIFGLFDRLWDKLCDFGANCGSSSAFISFIRNAFLGSGSFASFSLMIMFFSIGFGVTTLALGTFNTIKAAFIIFGIVVSLLLLPGRRKWKACLENSMFWHFVQYIFD